MISTSDFKKGQRVELDGQPWSVERSTTQSPSARGGATLVKARLRNILTGQISDRTFKAGEKFNEPDLQMRPSQFLYRSTGDESFVFMDLQSYEQFELGPDALGDDAQWLVDNLEVRAIVYNERVVSVELPQFVEMALADVAPGTKGDTASGGVTTTATTITGISVQVPLYIKAGEVVRIDTTTGTFKDRVGR
jgi:elongation factor P